MKMNIFDRFNEWINDFEGSFVNSLTAFAPWIAPLAPAYMTYVHMVDFLEFPKILAFALAVMVEILGFGTVSTGLDFWFYNRRERAGNKKAPLTIIIITFAFYLVLILVSNVVIDISNAYLSEAWQKGAVILVRLLLTLQTIPGALMVAARTGHRDLLKEIKKEKEQKLSEIFPKVRGESDQNGQNFPKTWHELLPTLSPDDIIWWSFIDSDIVKEMSKKHKVSERTITNWRTNAQKLSNGVQNEESI